jgi:spore germination protein KB
VTTGQSRARVGRRELTSMLTLLIATHAFLNYPNEASVSGLEAAWMEPIISGVCALIAFLIMDALFRKFFPGVGLLDVMKTAFGKYVSIIFSLALAAYFIMVTAGIMRQFAETVIITVLPSTPIIVVSALFVITVSYVATCGLEAVVRVAQLAFPLFVFGMLGLCILTMNWWHPVLLFPFWGAGISSIAMGSVRTSSVFLNILLLSVIYPHAKDHRDLRKVGVRSTIYGMLLLVAFLLVYHMVFAPTETAKLSSPIYSVARLIHIGRFVQRIESIYIFIWVSAAVLKMAITTWAATYILTYTFDWPSYRPIIPAVGLLCWALSLFPTDVVSVIRSQYDTLMMWSWIVIFVLPIVFLVVGLMRQRMKRGAHSV